MENEQVGTQMAADQEAVRLPEQHDEVEGFLAIQGGVGEVVFFAVEGAAYLGGLAGWLAGGGSLSNAPYAEIQADAKKAARDWLP